MKSWTPTPPPESSLNDHDVPLLHQHLVGKRIALLVCGGIAAMKAPLLARTLRRAGATVIAYVSTEALKYVAADALQWATNNPLVTQLSPQSEHLQMAHAFDAYVVAPATYNTINKFRFGVADSTITTTLATALGFLERRQTRILLAPTMHGHMHNSILHESLLDLQRRGIFLIPPREANGKHNLPDEDLITACVCAELSPSSLKGEKILLTAGATPTPIDDVRCITNRFRGRLGVEIAKELTWRGANVRLIMGAGSVSWPNFIEAMVARDFQTYKQMVLEQLDSFQPAFGIFSAAVADYAPKHTFKGKIPSDANFSCVELIPTEKIVDLAQAHSPQMKMLSFKYQVDMNLDELFSIGQKRLNKGHLAVVVNRGDEIGPQGEQVAYLMSKATDPQKMISKSQIAAGICDFMEQHCDKKMVHSTQHPSHLDFIADSAEETISLGKQL